MPIGKVEFEIQVAQTILGQFLGFDRVSFAEFQEDGSLVVLSSTAVEGFEPTPLGQLPGATYMESWPTSGWKNRRISKCRG
jgi:hypothetical protein